MYYEIVRILKPKTIIMKLSVYSMIAIFVCLWVSSKSQEIDTLLDVGGSRFHFHIIKGQGMPILFESGGGNDGSVWNAMLKPLAVITKATLITYDRSGLGKSELDTSKFWMRQSIEALQTALNKLGYNGDIMLVAHSLGGFYATAFTAKHFNRVKAAVFFDVNHISFFTDGHVQKMLSVDTSWPEQFKNRVFLNTIEIMRKTPFPGSIPVINIVAEKTLFEGTPDAERWKKAHHDFVIRSKNRESITAHGSGHYIFLSNKALAINAIVKAYVGTVHKDQQYAILKRANEYSITAANEVQQGWINYMHSENDLNSWGYDLLQKGNPQLAVEVFKLNVSLHPESANTYDSLADGYESLGEKDLAIKNYKRCLEIDPNKSHASKRLKILAANSQ